LLAATLFLAGVPATLGMCPAGFNEPERFPADWEIPQWPNNMTQERAGKLKTVRFGGFKIEDFNQEFLEGPGIAFYLQGKRTFWQADGQYFLYWCQQFRKWRIAGISGFSKNKNGACLAFASDGQPDRDILNASLLKGWIEVEKGAWTGREEAGVVSIGQLSDQFAGAAEAEQNTTEDDDNTTEEAAECASEGDEADGSEDGFKGGQKKANCPVMPVVRKVKERVKEKVVEAGKAASKWARRLFPQLMGPAPAEAHEERSPPEDDETAAPAADVDQL